MDESLQQQLQKLIADLPEEDRNTLLQSDNRSLISHSQNTKEIQELKQKVEHLQKKEEFSPGDIVRWKLGLKNKKYPKEGQPAYVMECLSNAIKKEDKDPGNPYFREPLDIILACLEEDGDLLIFYYDSRRFEKISSSS